MPIMWFAKDGPGPHSQDGPPVNVSMDEARRIVGLRELKFVGLEPPIINEHRPSRADRNVVFELRSVSETGERFPEPGFYFVVGLLPEEAVRALEEMRA